MLELGELLTSIFGWAFGAYQGGLYPLVFLAVSDTFYGRLVPTFPHYTSRKTLERSKLHVPVVYPSHFSYTGFGHR